MPLSKRARIEVYLPDEPKAVYRRLRKEVEREFLFTFGGRSVVRGMKGLYLRSGSTPETDKITLVYADMPFDFMRNRKAISEYADSVREACAESLPEESILVVVDEVYHSI